MAVDIVLKLHGISCALQGKRREGSETAVFYVSFVSGFAAGSFAAFCVTPLDGKSDFCVSFIIFTISVLILCVYDFMWL